MCEYVHPLTTGFRRRETEASSDLHGKLQLLDQEWRNLRASDWVDLPGLIQTLHFGRIVLRPLMNNDSELNAMTKGNWLLNAFNDGWLEMVHLAPHNDHQLSHLIQWQEQYRRLPIYVDPTRIYFEDSGNKQMQALLRFEGLQGLILSPSDFVFPCVKSFAGDATNLRYLQLLGLKATKTSVRLLEQLAALKHLRSLLISGGHPDDATVELVLAAQHLGYLGLYAKNVTDCGLARLAELASLRVLTIDVPLVSRAGVRALRGARPDLTIIVEGDTRCRIGPA